ncbi:hypothetical protein P4C99_13625 [Pontiellaceae bacterium B1224]|nr:hypothetical protein [Pontiellaceae bacterium B1224]
MKKLHFLVSLILIFFSSHFCVADVKAEQEDMPVPSHADAAIILTKYSGLFDRYVTQQASLGECVSFLNGRGIYFGLMEVVNGSEFTVKDCARVMGQIELLFAGEAEFLTGKVILPKGIASWEEFCIMQGVDYVTGYQSIVEALILAHQLND